jgi:membrane protein YqaA with SNARE-associated domain
MGILVPVASKGNIMLSLEQQRHIRKPGIGRRLYHWVLHWAETPYGLLALAVLAFSEASFFPIPPDPLLIALGLALPQRAFVYALVCSVSSVSGGLFGYLLGWGLWESLGQVFFAYVPGFTPEVFDLVQAKYQQYSFWAVFSAGFTPIPYKVFTLAAGVFGINLGVFLLASGLSRSARFFLIGYLIWQFGSPVKTFIERYFNLLSVVFVVLLILGFLVLKLAL